MDSKFADALFDLDRQFPTDAFEAQVPDAAVALAQLTQRRPDLTAIMSETGKSFLAAFGAEHQDALKRTQDALAISFARMAWRHGSWGSDLHEYHNEAHILEILAGRMGRVRHRCGWRALEAEEWLLLCLFATCHDLRQRESPAFWHAIGANERASVAEAFRILDLAGFERQRDRDFYLSLGLTIAGSTFDARPIPPRFNTAEVASSGGCLAPKLIEELGLPGTGDGVAARHARLMLIAADLDTANVAEPFAALAGSGVRLVQEREKRAGRSLRAAESALPVFEFLTDGQKRYFFELHRFVSPLGQAVFGEGKNANAERAKAQHAAMLASFPGGPGAGQTGQDVIDRFLRFADGS